MICNSTSFAETLRSLGVQAESILYEGKTHTDVFLQVYKNVAYTFMGAMYMCLLILSLFIASS